MFLSNEWLVWFWQNYSMAITFFPSAIIGILKIIAVLKPSVKTDKIRELIQQWAVSKKGGLE